MFLLLLIKMPTRPQISPPHLRPHAAPTASPGYLSLIVPDDVFLCSDKWMAAPSQIWQIYVHFLERVDVSCVTGQRNCQSLVLRGKQAIRKVKCFSSHPQEIEVHIYKSNLTDSIFFFFFCFFLCSPVLQVQNRTAVHPHINLGNAPFIETYIKRDFISQQYGEQTSSQFVVSETQLGVTRSKLYLV